MELLPKHKNNPSHRLTKRYISVGMCQVLDFPVSPYV